MTNNKKWLKITKENANNTVAMAYLKGKISRRGIYDVDLIREALTRAKTIGFGTVEIGFRKGIMFLGRGRKGVVVAPMTVHRDFVK